MKKVMSVLLFLALVSPAWAWGTTYYVSNANPLGNDGNNGTSASAPWLTLNKVNATRLNPGDSVLFHCGCTWRGQLVISSSGASGSPITFGSYGTGDKPRIYASTQLTKWTGESATLWYAPEASAPTQVWFAAAAGSVAPGVPKTAKASLTAEYEWWYDAADSRLYVYAPSSPASRYSSVECGAYDRVIDASGGGYGYITVEGLDLAYANWYGIDTRYQTGGWVIENNTIHNIGLTGNITNGADGVVVSAGSAYIAYNTIHDCGWHGIAFAVDESFATLTGATVEHNTLYDNYHSNIDMQAPAGTFKGAIIRYNLIYDDKNYNPAYDGGGIYAMGTEGHAISGVQIYYNVLYNLTGTAIVIRDLVPSAVIYNNTIYGTLPGSSQYAGGIDIFSISSYNPSNIVVKNNIVQDTHDTCFHVDNPADITACDYNDWYMSGNGTKIYAMIKSTSYYYNSQAAYKAATGWDAHGLWQAPLFVSTATPDLRLQSGSPAIRKGTGVGIATDFAGNSVPAVPDLGAYEFEATLSPPSGLRLIQ